MWHESQGDPEINRNWWKHVEDSWRAAASVLHRPEDDHALIVVWLLLVTASNFGSAALQIKYGLREQWQFPPLSTLLLL